MVRSFFLSLDGLDGSGKSTQCLLLSEWLRGRGWPVTVCADPGGTAVGELLREILLHHRQEMGLWCEALLFMASRAQLTSEIIRPALAAGQVVITDRYLLANVVYQGHAGGLDPKEVWKMGRFATGGLQPDLTFVLDLPVEESLSRRADQADRIESRAWEYHRRVRAGFLSEAHKNPVQIRVINAQAPIAVIHEAICKEVARVLAGGSGA